MKTRLLRYAIAAVALLAVFSCTENIEPGVQPVEQTPQGKTYSMTVTASKGEITTKALAISGITLNATWAENEVVKVFQGESEVGTLKAQSSGSSTSLKGDITGTFATNETLTLKFCGPDYGEQDGTLAYIAANCDYAMADVKVKSITDGNITTTDATFVNQQAIVEFTLQESDGTAIVGGVTSLTVVAGATTIQVTPASATDPLYVAIPALSGSIRLEATVNDGTTRSFSKEDATFVNGKFYKVDVKMAGLNIVTTEAQLRAAVTGTSPISIKLGADIRLEDVNDCLLIEDSKDVTIDLNGHELNRALETYSGTSPNGHVIGVRAGSSVTINDGSGTNAGSITGGWAGNGGGIYNNSGATVTINGGTITGNHAKTTGGGIYNAGTLIINGGVISDNQAGDSENNGNGGGIYNTANGSVTFNDGSITGNTCTEDGGGVVNNGSFTMSGGRITGNTAYNDGGGICSTTALTVTGGSVTGNTATTGKGGGIEARVGITMSGDPVVSDNKFGNTANNLYLASGQVITVDGAFTEGANIGVTLADGSGVVTSGYSGPDPSTLFNSDKSAYKLSNSITEVELIDFNYVEGGPVMYRNVDETGYHGDLYCDTWTRLSSIADNNPVLTTGWYVLDKNLTFNTRINVGSNETVNVILPDNTELNANMGIDVSAGATLHFWAQSHEDENDLGQVIANASTIKGKPGIGGYGYLYFHGGSFGVYGGEEAAGIMAPGDNTTLDVYDSGNYNYSVSIFGGAIIAFGGDRGAGIGGGRDQLVGNILITGGYVYAYARINAAGIGSGFEGFTTVPSSELGSISNGQWTVIRITGGNVFARGESAAGIGGGYRRGGQNLCGAPAKVFIEGGTVEARTDDGVKVEAMMSDGSMSAAIAIGWGSGGFYVSEMLHIYDGAKVSANRSINGPVTLQTAVESRDYKVYELYKQIKIEPCTNHQYENGKCKWCNHPEP